MTARGTAGLALAVLTVAGSSACGDNLTPVVSEVKVSPEREFDLGAHRVRVTVPAGWDALDQGQQKRFRKGEFEIVLRNLGPATPPSQDMDALVDWGLAGVGHDQRREVKSRRAVTLDGREAVDIETWHRLDHTNPQRIFFVKDEGDLLALHTVRMAFKDSLAAFDAIRDSLHFVSTRR